MANLAETSRYLTLAAFPAGTQRRATPAKFDVLEPYVSIDGASIFLCGSSAADVRLRRGGDGSNIKKRLYRYDLRSGRFTPLFEGGE